jgi:hypothetical protein
MLNPGPSFPMLQCAKTVKNTATYLAAIALAIALVLGIALQQERSALAADEETILQFGRQSALISSLVGVRVAARAAELKVETLEKKVQGEEDALAKARLQAGIDESRLQETPSSAQAAKGTYVLPDGTIVYGKNTLLRLRNGTIVSSPTGVMVSDAGLDHIDGDLLIESEHRTMKSNGAFIYFEGGNMRIDAQGEVQVQNR